MTGESLPESGMARRWAIQDIRYLFSTVPFTLSLSDEERRSSVFFQNAPELRPSMAVLEALVTGDASELTKYPWADGFGLL